MSLEFDIFFLVRVPELKLKLTEEILSVHEIFERYFSRDEACCFREFGYFCFEQFSSTPDTSFTLQLSVVPARGSHSKPRLLAPSVKLPQQISSHFRDKFLRDTFSLGFLFTAWCVISRINNTSDCPDFFFPLVISRISFSLDKTRWRKQRVTLLVRTTVKLPRSLFTAEGGNTKSSDDEAAARRKTCFSCEKKPGMTNRENNYRADKLLSNERDVSSWSSSARELI